MHSPLSILIQEYEQRELEEEEGVDVLGDVEVFAMTDPCWRLWNELAPFEILRKELLHWERMVE